MPENGQLPNCRQIAGAEFDWGAIPFGDELTSIIDKSIVTGDFTPLPNILIESEGSPDADRVLRAAGRQLTGYLELGIEAGTPINIDYQKLRWQDIDIVYLRGAHTTEKVLVEATQLDSWSKGDRHVFLFIAQIDELFHRRLETVVREALTCPGVTTIASASGLRAIRQQATMTEDQRSRLAALISAFEFRFELSTPSEARLTKWVIGQAEKSHIQLADTSCIQAMIRKSAGNLQRLTTFLARAALTANRRIDADFVARICVDPFLA